MALPKLKGIETELTVSLWNSEKGTFVEQMKMDDLILMVGAIRKFFLLPWPSNAIGEVENIDRAVDLPSDRPRARIALLTHGMLPNGSRFYVDVPNLEYSTPECLSAKTLLIADKAGEVIANLAKAALEEAFAKYGKKIVIYKDSSDRKGNSCGCHENYLLPRETFREICRPTSPASGFWISFLVGRILVTGAGKIGSELVGAKNTAEGSIYQISQRADFMTALYNECTVKRRALVNLRDEPLADGRRFARLHVISGEPNIADYAGYLKPGLSSIALSMAEDGFIPQDVVLADPVEAMKLASRDLSCRQPVLETIHGRKLSLLDWNERFSEIISSYFQQVRQPDEEEKDLQAKYLEIIDDFRTGREERLRKRLDWKVKEKIFDIKLKQYGCSFKEISGDLDKPQYSAILSQLQQKDYRYHDIDKISGFCWDLRATGEIEVLAGKKEIARFVKEPPIECRSYFRGRAVAGFLPTFSDWHELSFEDAGEPKREDYQDFIISSPVQGRSLVMSNPLWGGKSEAIDWVLAAPDFHVMLKRLADSTLARKEVS